MPSTGLPRCHDILMATCKGDAVEELAGDAQDEEHARIREGGHVVADALRATGTKNCS